MALLPSPTRLRRLLADGAAAVVRRALGIHRTPPGEQLHRVSDDLPRDMLFAQPLVCDVSGAEERLGDGSVRATFRVLVRDATGRRCPDLSVEARVRGPERTATGATTTSMLGVATFRMQGPPGTYAVEVTDVAAHALEWDVSESTTEAIVTA